MQARTLVVLGLLAASLGLAFYVLTAPSAWPHRFESRNANLANGETMFHIGGCASCHSTPKQDDHRRLGGGLALETPFGTFKVPNISPDAKFGIGGWPEEAFVNAMLRGVGRNGEHLYPTFPYTSYQRMSLDDVRDLFAFLKSLPPEAVASEPHALPFPFNVRRGLGLWKLLYLDDKMFVPDPAKSAALNRGAYLVEGPGHCAECHSPRDIFGGIVADRRFAGGSDAKGKGWVPNITPHANGIPSWSTKDVSFFLESGLAPDGASVGSSMSDVISNTAKLTAEDRAAMAAYLKSLPPRPGKRPAKK
jgi:mono/diheme cytochrome c family protein